ncbi:hypothetical protein [Burkholderia ambifaria]|uniref:hypothetical protein n=1 Tax=Burkholderia ambifaria TaxID=152480 RepID=UPI003C7E5DC9
MDRKADEIFFRFYFRFFGIDGNSICDGVYVRNWDGGDGVCSDMSRSEITGYMEKYAKQKGASDVVFDGNFEYMKDLHQWKVPYRSDGRRYVAKMTCLGVILDNVGPYD